MISFTLQLIICATFKSIEYNIAMTFILNNNKIIINSYKKSITLQS